MAQSCLQNPICAQRDQNNSHYARSTTTLLLQNQQRERRVLHSSLLRQRSDGTGLAETACASLCLTGAGAGVSPAPTAACLRALLVPGSDQPRLTWHSIRSKSLLATSATNSRRDSGIQLCSAISSSRLRLTALRMIHTADLTPAGPIVLDLQ